MGKARDPDSKSAIDLMIDARLKMTPKTGANLVGIDSFGLPGDELYLIGHFDTVEEAKAAQAQRPKDEDTVIYEAPSKPARRRRSVSDGKSKRR